MNKIILALCFVAFFVQCSKKTKEDKFSVGVWTTSQETFDKEQWQKDLEEYNRIGINQVLVNNITPNDLKILIPMAKEKDIKVHAWFISVNRPGDSVANKHPEWYAVNRNGENSLEKRAYVDYYQWLSPFHPDARQHIKDLVKPYLEVDGLESLHLDYIRFSDVFLPTSLLPKYNLIQDSVMAEYDYDYHPIAREGYKKTFGIDPKEMKHSELSPEWKQFRMNAVTSLVNEIVEMGHKKGVKISAAVFPFPERARFMVLQDWSEWNLDEVYPMIYNSFYNEGTNWIGFSVEEGVKSVKFPLHAGLFLPGFKNPKELEHAINISKQKGAKGVTLFSNNNLTDEVKEVLIKLKEGK